MRCLGPAGRAGQRAGAKRDDPVPAVWRRSGIGRIRGTRPPRPWRPRAGRPGGRTGNPGPPARSRPARRSPTSPAPSSTWPVMVMAPGVPSGTTNGPSGHGRTMARNGPTVCDGVMGRLTASSCVSKTVAPGPRSTMSHSKPSAQSGSVRPRSNRAIIRCAGLRVGHRVEDRVLREQRVTGEVHLGHQPLRERPAEQREVDVGRPPGVEVVPPRIGTRLDRDEPVPAVGVGHAAAGAVEVGVERCRVVVDLVRVPAGRVRLPDLDQSVSDRPARRSPAPGRSR